MWIVHVTSYKFCGIIHGSLVIFREKSAPHGQTTIIHPSTPFSLDISRYLGRKMGTSWDAQTYFKERIRYTSWNHSLLTHLLSININFLIRKQVNHIWKGISRKIAYKLIKNREDAREAQSKQRYSSLEDKLPI